jgi:Ca2+-binding RTX toxin-like protein
LLRLSAPEYVRLRIPVPACHCKLGQAGNDALIAGDGDGDFLDGGLGDDILDGGNGLHDLVSYEFRTANVFAQLGGRGGVTGETDQITFVEDLRGGLGDDLLIGDERDNRLEGFLGNNTLIGRPGADLLIGSDGNDLLFSNSFSVPPAAVHP